jgi:alpha-1,2-mannosyltransferase
VYPLIYIVFPWVIAWDLMFLRQPLRAFAFADFATFYDTGRAWLAGRDLYLGGITAGFPNLNPPVATVLFVPFALLPQRPAMVAWLACNLLGIFFSVRLITRELALDTSLNATLTRLAWLGLLMPTIQILASANLTGLLMWPATLAWRDARRQRDLSAGLWLGLVFALKPNFLVFVPYWLLRRRWRSAAGSLIITSGAAAVGWLLFGPTAYQSWATAVRSITWFTSWQNASILGVLGNSVPDAWVWPLWAIASASVVLAVINTLGHTRGSVDRDWAVVWIGALLIAPLGWLHYYTLAAGPLAATCRTGSRWLLLTVIALCIPPFLLKALAPNVSVVVWFASCLGGFATLSLFFLLLAGPGRTGDRRRQPELSLTDGPSASRQRERARASMKRPRERSDPALAASSITRPATGPGAGGSD